MSASGDITTGTAFRGLQAIWLIVSALILVGVGLMIEASPIAAGICLAAGCAGLLFMMHPLKAAMAFIVLKGITDGFWFVKVGVMGFELSLQRITGVLFPSLGLAALLTLWMKDKLPRLPLSSLLLCFSCLAAVSLLRSPIPKEALPDVLKLVGCFVFYYLGFLYFTGEQRLQLFSKWYVVFGLFPFLSVILQQAGVIDLLAWGVTQSQVSWMGGEAVRRYAGIYSDAATTSIFLLVSLALIFAAITHERRALVGRFYLILCAFYMYALVISSFRIVWAALFVQVMLWFYTSRSKKTFLLLMLASCLLALYSYDEIYRVLDLRVLLQAEGLSGKMGFWIILLRIFLAGDWTTRLFGQGFMANADILRNTRGAEIAGQSYSFSEGWGGKAHSDIIEFLTDIGIVGLLLYLAILWILGRRMWQLRKRTRDEFVQLLTRAWLCIFSTYLLYSAIGNSSRYPALTWPMWFLAGGILRREGASRDRG